MKKKWFILIIPFLILTACNLPAAAVTPTPRANAVATEVGFLLTSQPTATPLPATVTPEVQPSATPQPSAAPATPTITASPTLPPGDLRQSLGDPAWKETFKPDSRSFGQYTNDKTTVKLENNALVLTALTTEGWHAWTLTSRKPGKFYMEAQFTTRTCANNDLYGLVVRAPNYDSGKGYYYGITCDGRYNFGRWDENSLSRILQLAADPAIVAGAGQTNRIGILVDGSNFKLYANGKLLTEVSDNVLGADGHIGAFIAGYSVAGFSVAINQIEYWNLP